MKETAIRANEVEEALQALATPERAIQMPKYFKTGKGEYGEGDIFLGVSVPDQRAVAKEVYKDMSAEVLTQLLQSPIHEMRLTGLFVLVSKYEKTKDVQLKDFWKDFYLDHLDYVNNWDLVDSSAHKIVGEYAFRTQNIDLLSKLATDDNMWKRRVAVVGSSYFIKKKQYQVTANLVLENLEHKHDLMQKANGWMLREIGKVDEQFLIDFLEKNYAKMPRTTLRYAIEKFDEDQRQQFLKGIF